MTTCFRWKLKLVENLFWLWQMALFSLHASGENKIAWKSLLTTRDAVKSGYMRPVQNICMKISSELWEIALVWLHASGEKIFAWKSLLSFGILRWSIFRWKIICIKMGSVCAKLRWSGYLLPVKKYCMTITSDVGRLRWSCNMLPVKRYWMKMTFGRWEIALVIYLIIVTSHNIYF